MSGAVPQMIVYLFLFFKTKSQFLPGTHQFGQVAGAGGSEHPRMASLLSHHWDEKRPPPYLSLSIRRDFWWVELGFSCSHTQAFAGGVSPKLVFALFKAHLLHACSVWNIFIFTNRIHL